MTTEHHSPAAPQRVLGDSRGERRIVALIGTSVLALALTGMYVSFRTVYAYVLPYFHGTAWAVPSGVDLAILVFSAADLMLMYWDIPMPGLRLVPWAFTAATIALNWQSGGPLPIRIAHAAMPSLWVIFCEYARHVIRHRVGLVAGTRMEKIRKSRWLLAPWSTARMWRRMILWEITNYRAGLDMEADRLTRRALLELEYGRRWRRKAPATKLLPLKLGALAPADSLGELTRTGLLDLDFGALGVKKELPAKSVQVAAPEQLDGSDQTERLAISAQPQVQAPAQVQPQPPVVLPAPQVNAAAHAPATSHAAPAYNGHQFNGFAGAVNGSANGTVNGSAASSSISGAGYDDYDVDPDEQPQAPRFDPRGVRGAYDNRSARAADGPEVRDGRDDADYDTHRDPRDPRDPMYARNPRQFAEYAEFGEDAPEPVAQVPDQRRPSNGYTTPQRARHDLEVRFAAPPARQHQDHEEPEDDLDGDFDELIPVETPPEPTVVIGKQRQQFEDALDRMVQSGDMRILSPDMRESSAAAWEAASTLDLALATERAFRYGAEYRDRILAKGLTMEMADAMGIEYNGDQ